MKLILLDLSLRLWAFRIREFYGNGYTIFLFFSCVLFFSVRLLTSTLENVPQI